MKDFPTGEMIFVVDPMCQPGKIYFVKDAYMNPTTEKLKPSKPTARLISYTQGAKLTEVAGMTPRELVVYTARVSNPNNQTNMLTAEKLLSFLQKSKHWSPFDMVDATVEVKTSRAIAHQILRHRSAMFQEFSQRYAEVEDPEPYLFDLRLKGASNRQSSLQGEGEGFEQLRQEWLEDQNVEFKAAFNLYNHYISMGAAPEVARAILSEGNTWTTLYMKNSMRGWIHYLQVRDEAHAQLEHQEVAWEIEKVLQPIFGELFWKEVSE